MAFRNEGVMAPEGPHAQAFTMRPLRATDVELDYAAVMESREQLRMWDQSTWPADDFTVAENLADLEKLERRHAAGESFTYTVMTPDGTRCLGCVYVNAPDARMYAGAEITAIGDSEWSDHDATIHFWVTSSRLSDRTDRALLDTMRPWLAEEWAFERPLIVASELFDHQVGMIEETDLERRFDVRRPDDPAAFFAYA